VCVASTNIQLAREKIDADAPTDNASPDAKAEPKPDNKHRKSEAQRKKMRMVLLAQIFYVSKRKTSQQPRSI